MPRNKERDKKTHQKWYKKNKKRISILAKEYSIKNKTQIETKNKNWYNKNSLDVISKTLKRRYGISLEEYNELLNKQNKVCAICKGANKIKRLYVDHNHKTNRIRGLLCQQCNTGLGHFKDSPKLLIKAARYLQ